MSKATAAAQKVAAAVSSDVNANLHRTSITWEGRGVGTARYCYCILCYCEDTEAQPDITCQVTATMWRHQNSEPGTSLTKPKLFPTVTRSHNRVMKWKRPPAAARDSRLRKARDTLDLHSEQHPRTERGLSGLSPARLRWAALYPNHTVLLHKLKSFYSLLPSPLSSLTVCGRFETEP